MGLWSAIKAVGTGDFGNVGNYLFTSEDDIATKISVDNAQEALIKERAAEGTIGEEKAMGFLNDIQRNAYPVLWEQYGSPSAEFKDSLKEQVNVLPDRLLGKIPWYVWVLLVGALLVYLSPLLAAVLKRR